MNRDLPRRLLDEALGTLLLVCTVVGSGITAETLTDDVALALLDNTIPTGAILVGLFITAAYWFTASISFANPAVTFGRAFTDTFSGIYPGHVPDRDPVTGKETA